MSTQQLEELAALAARKSDWEATFDELTEELDCEDGVELGKDFLEICIVRDINPQELVNILLYVEDKYFDCPVQMDWETAMFLVAKHGTRRAFRKFFQERPAIDEDLLYDIILSGAESSGREGLREVLSWLSDFEDLKEVTQTYISSVDHQGSTLSTSAGEIILQLLRHTNTELHDYDFLPDGPVATWFEEAV